MTTPLQEQVWRRARGACEYCQITQEFDPLPFQIDHIVAKKHGGETTPENLALACFSCNNHKGPNIAGIDPADGQLSRLFHPRRDRWNRHFAWRGARLEGLTPPGRTTVVVLAINLPRRVALRDALMLEGVFPPPIAPPGETL